MQSGRPWLTLLACVATAGGVNAQMQAPGDAAAGSAPSNEPPATQSDWRLPPLRLSGSLAYDVNASRAQQEGRTVSQLVTANITAGSFIYQPWFAQVSGSLGMTTSMSHTSAGSSAFDGSDPSVHQQLRRRDQFITGNARINLFPLSRFPFEAHLERNDSRIDAGLGSIPGFRTQTFGVVQRYRPPNGAYTLLGSYDHREQSGGRFSGSQDALNGDFSTRWKANELSVGLAYNQARTPDSDDKSRFGSLVAHHTYAPSSALSVSSSMNWTRTEQGAGEFASDVSALQGSSVGLWRREGSPLTLTASARALMLRESVKGGSLDSAGLTAGVNYEVNRNLRVNASGGANFNRSDDRDSTALTGSAGATYQGDGLQIAGFRYDWFGGASAGASVSEASSRAPLQQQTLSLQLGHSLNRAIVLGPQSNLSFSAAQSMSWSRSFSSLHEESDAHLAASPVLLNTLGATWQMGGGRQSAYARASYNDSIELGGSRARFRLLNVQLSGSAQLENRRSLNGSLTYQYTIDRPGSLLQSGDLAVPSPVGAGTISGEITYSQQRPFGVSGLRFVSRLKLAQDVLSQPGVLVSLPDHETQVWENRLDWSIGRLESQAVLRISRVGGKRWDSLMLRVQRTFGD